MTHTSKYEVEVKLLDQLPLRIFTPGPTVIPQAILKIGTEQPPYNRTDDFSRVTLEILEGLKKIFRTKEELVILTASGTAAMEACVLGFLDRQDHVLIVNGGTFGQRWVDLCTLHEVSFKQIKLAPGETIFPKGVESYLTKEKFDALLINAHETSTGALYDVQQIGRITRQFEVLFVVDAISTVCADPFYMDDWLVDVAILSSQKALALPPGLSFVAFNQFAKAKLNLIKPRSLYFDLNNYLENQKRGQMPYTPAIGLFMMLHQRLKDIDEIGVETLISQQAVLASYFRSKTSDMPFKVLPKSPSNALTALWCDEGIDAFEIVRRLKDRYNTFVAPNGGDLRDRVFRVSHMGDQTKSDIDFLVEALRAIVIEMNANEHRRLDL